MQGISVIIPTLNGEHRLPRLLKSLREQQIDQSFVEIIVVDDDSTDATVSVAQQYGATVVRNGHRNIERGKSIGMEVASHELLFFIDDDNRLPHKRWLALAIQAIESDARIVGVQSARFAYVPTDPAANRYCSIFGINDPMAFYLRRRDRLTVAEDTWSLPGSVMEETADWWLVQFTPGDFLTIGSQGYLTRRSLLKRTNWTPYLFHIDSNYELVQNGYNRFVMLKNQVVHDHCVSVEQLVKKLHRNMRLFLEQSHLRKFTWETPMPQLVAVTLRMLTVIGPLATAARMYLKTKDSACFLHPYLSFRVPSMYIGQMLGHRLRLIRQRQP